MNKRTFVLYDQFVLKGREARAGRCVPVAEALLLS